VQFKRVSFRKRDNVVEKDKQSKQKSDILFWISTKFQIDIINIKKDDF
jgi:hypothetical protein